MVGKNCTVGIHTVTHINQNLDSNWIYVGRPARKYKHIKKDNHKKDVLAQRRIVDTGEKIPFDTKQFSKKNS